MPRTSPLTRDEVRVDYWFHVLTAPADAFVEINGKFVVPDSLAADLLAQLNREREARIEWFHENPPPDVMLTAMREAGLWPPRPSRPPQTVLAHWDTWLNWDYCRFCFKHFVQLEVSRRPLHFCSDKCHDRHTRERWQVYNDQRGQERAATRANLVCEQCGDPLTTRRSHTRYCSDRCKKAARRRRLHAAI